MYPSSLVLHKVFDGKSSLNFLKWIVSKSYNTNTLKRIIFILLKSIPSSNFLCTCFAGTGSEKQKQRTGAVQLFHLPLSPHQACLGSLQPHPARPTSCLAKPHSSSVHGSTSLPMQQLYHLGCYLLCLYVDITFFTQVLLSN